MRKNLTKQTSIYVGLNDAETGIQKFDTELYRSILRNVCKNYGVAFSTHEIKGGYFHEDGRYTEENTLVIMLMDTPEETVIEIAKDLCAFFNQESVMVTNSPASVFFISERIDGIEELQEI